MSIAGDLNTEIYKQMVDLQEKLKQSEAERVRLEEMYNILMRTLQDEENKRVKSLENRYFSFLEDCAKRSNRNEKILRSIERVESGANILHAKTERLKLLRNHYEAYLERVVPAWKQPVLPLHYNVHSVQDLDWIRSNHLKQDEINEMYRSNYYPSMPVMKPSTSSMRLPLDNHLNKLYESRVQNFKQLPNYKNYSSKRFWSQADQEADRVDLGRYDNLLEDLGYQGSETRSDTVPFSGKIGLDYHEEDVDDEIAMLNTMLLQEDPSRSNVWHLPKRLMQRQGIGTERPDDERSAQTKFVTGKENSTGWSKVKNSVVGNQISKPVSEHYENKPMITREPVEIKKPEILVGKLQPDTKSKFEYFAKVPHRVTPDEENLKMTSEEAITESDKQPVVEKQKAAEPVTKWSLLKHKKTIEKLKQSIAYGDEIISEGVKSVVDINSSEPKKNEFENTGDETDVSQSLSEACSADRGNVINDKGLNKNKEGMAENGSYQKEEEENNVDFYEDNEENYPESYYEQPPKPVYPTSIAANVILEEDESEANQDEVSGQPQRGEDYEAPKNEEYNAEKAEVQYENKKIEETSRPEDSTYQEQDPQIEATTQEYSPQEQLQQLQDKESYQQYMDNQQYQESNNYQQEVSEFNREYQGANYEHFGNMYQEQYQQEGNYYNQGGENQQHEESYNQMQNFYDQNGDIQQYENESRDQVNNFYDQTDGIAVQYQEYTENQQENPTNVEGYQEDGSNGVYLNLPLRQNTLAHLMESDSESFQMEHGSGIGNGDSDFDFSLSQKQ